MKNFRYIFLFLFLGFFAKSNVLIFHGYSKVFGSTQHFNGNSQKIEKSKFVIDVKFHSSNVKRQKKPKKPKGIQVIVPNVSTVSYNSFYRYSEFTIHEVDANYTLVLHYSHGKRGPPSLVI